MKVAITAILKQELDLQFCLGSKVTRVPSAIADGLLICLGNALLVRAVFGPRHRSYWLTTEFFHFFQPFAPIAAPPREFAMATTQFRQILGFLCAFAMLVGLVQYAKQRFAQALHSAVDVVSASTLAAMLECATASLGSVD
jgi:uncharacterized membrane protein SirB2